MNLGIAMCWDGETPTAELILGGMKFVGHPAEVEAAFEALSQWRDESAAKQQKLDYLFRAFEKALGIAL